jgi:hypothetical protein
MQFMMILKSTAHSEAGGGLDPRLAAAINEQAERDKRAGKLLVTGALLPSSNGTRVRVANGKVSVTDGPFSETKELVGGFAIFEVNSREEAIEGAKAFMQLYADVLGPSYEGQIELRPLMSPAYVNQRGVEAPAPAKK